MMILVDIAQISNTKPNTNKILQISPLPHCPIAYMQIKFRNSALDICVDYEF